MESFKKIYLHGLPPRIEAALQEQLDALKTAPPQRVMVPAEADIIIVAGAELADAPRAIPVIALPRGRNWRLGALLRQLRQVLDEPALYLEPFALGAYIFHPQEKQLTDSGEAVIDLTDKEVEILVYLARRSTPASRDDLLRDVWRYQDGVDTHTLETHIYRLRQKIEKSADNPQLLVTGEQGYILNS